MYLFSRTYLVQWQRELIYGCVYCRPQSSLFMLRQKKRQRRREVLRTVFVCHRVPFLIPQAPAMPAGAACGGGSRRKARLRPFFPCCSQSGAGGMGSREGPFESFKSSTPTPPPPDQQAVDLSCMRGNDSRLSAILIYVKGRIDDAEQTRGVTTAFR